MPTTALYHWSGAGSAIDVLLDLALVDQLRLASTLSTVEIGGILLGTFDGKYTVITNFEPIESEHRRGTAYSLSKRDESRLAARLESRRKNKSEVPVGFFRSHLRPGLFLDEGDNQVISSFFPNANQVALLVRPAPDRSAVGGFFFWEEGEINRKQTYLPFPMSAQELETGDFPIMEPVAPSINAPSAPVTAALPVSAGAAIPAQDFHNAETLDIPRPDAVTLVPEPPRRKLLETRPSMPSTPDRRRSWQLIALIAAAAAFGGYLIGTSGNNRDRFGARAGDITLNSEPEPPAPVPPKPVAAKPVTATPGLAGAPPTAQPLTATGSAMAAVSANKPGVLPSQAPVVKPVSPLPTPTRTKPEQAPAVIATTRRPSPDSAAASPLPGQPPPNADSNWQHFHPAQPTSASEVAAAEQPAPAPEATRPVARNAPIAVSSVSLEAVEGGSVSRAISKIPLFGSFHHSRSGSDFTPPQAVKSAAPNVPADLARELTGTLPVDLRLKVDSNGHVSSVEILSHQTAAEFVRLAGDAAYDWQFQPARMKDKAVASDVIAHFKFRPSL